MLFTTLKKLIYTLSKEKINVVFSIKKDINSIIYLNNMPNNKSLQVICII